MGPYFFIMYKAYLIDKKTVLGIMTRKLPYKNEYSGQMTQIIRLPQMITSLDTINSRIFSHSQMWVFNLVLGKFKNPLFNLTQMRIFNLVLGKFRSPLYNLRMFSMLLRKIRYISLELLDRDKDRSSISQCILRSLRHLISFCILIKRDMSQFSSNLVFQ